MARKKELIILGPERSNAEEMLIARGPWFGESFFTSFSSFEGRLVLEESHWKRLEHQWLFFQQRRNEEVGEEALLDLMEYVQAIKTFLKKVGQTYPHFYVRLTCWNAFSPEMRPSLANISSQYHWMFYACPLRKEETFLQNHVVDHVLPLTYSGEDARLWSSYHLKSGHYGAVWERKRLECEKYGLNVESTECLLRDENHYLQEGLSSNLFCLYGHKLVTPPKPYLAGICGESLLFFLRETPMGLSLGIDVEERQLQWNDIERADEIFLTNGVKGIISVLYGRGGDSTRAYGRSITDQIRLTYRKFL
jgi:branched-subunit amino acid aminotransferase/4-amino-4-deoxychorismate lyase